MNDDHSGLAGIECEMGMDNHIVPFLDDGLHFNALRGKVRLVLDHCTLQRVEPLGKKRIMMLPAHVDELSIGVFNLSGNDKLEKIYRDLFPRPDGALFNQ